MTQNNDSWLAGILRKRTPDSMRVLADLLEAGLRKGECTANDVRQTDFAEKNIIGATMKLLRNFGFEYRGGHTHTIAKQKHRREIKIWVLIDRRKAEEILITFRRTLLNAMPEPKQMEMI